MTDPKPETPEPTIKDVHAALEWLETNGRYQPLGVYEFHKKSSIDVAHDLAIFHAQARAEGEAAERVHWCLKVNSVLKTGEPAFNASDAKFRIKDDLAEARAEGLEEAAAFAERNLPDGAGYQDVAEGIRALKGEK